MSRLVSPGVRLVASSTIVLVAVFAPSGCGPNVPPDNPNSDAASEPDGGDPPDSRDNSDGPYDDFPATPILEGVVPASAEELFETPTSGLTGPCQIEPAPGSLFPRYWLRARFRAIATPGHNVFEFRLHAANQVNDLVVYTTMPSWTMPAEMWKHLNDHSAGSPIEVSIRSLRLDGARVVEAPTLPSLGGFTIAPVSATGSIVYWTSGPGNSVGELKGFEVGTETVQSVLTPTQANTGCVGCHTSTPDGEFVAFNSNITPINANPAYLDLRDVDAPDQQPAFLTDVARQMLGVRGQHQPIFSAGHWSSGDHVAIATRGTYSESTQATTDSTLIWIDLEATSNAENTGWGIFRRDGDTGDVAAPAFSRDGLHVAYAGAPYVSSGMNLDQGGGDIWWIPYGDRLGGTATKLAGASTSQFTEHYPAWSADDRLIAFVRAAPGINVNDHAMNEVFVVPFAGGAGGTAHRITANDPPSCGGVASPGATNSWPKWSPAVESSGGTSYYWLTFSSRRDPTNQEAGGRPRPQLYLGAITIKDGVMTSYPAIYLWNQPANENNHTPAWDQIEIPDPSVAAAARTARAWADGENYSRRSATGWNAVAGTSAPIR